MLACLDAIAFVEPFVQVEIGAAFGAKWSVFLNARLGANRAWSAVARPQGNDVVGSAGWLIGHALV